jgi:hypothetical protein
MANNYSQATISPDLPAALFSEAELQSLETACGLTCNKDGDNLYFFAGDFFSKEGEDEDGQDVNCLALLRAKLGQLDEAVYPHISIHGASTCSKMRQDEFGGFAYLITREGVRSLNTWQWLQEQIDAAPCSVIPAGGVPQAETPDGGE